MKKIYFLILVFSSLSAIYAQNFAIGNTTITFNDPSRSGGFGSGGGPGRQIQTEIYYPADLAGSNVNLANGNFPVLVFGHGFAMAWDAYANIWQALVPLGYIIAFPRTEGSLLPAPSHNDFGLDLALVEVKLQALNNNSSSIFYQKILNKSAIMGHSMGGGATFIAAANNNSPSLKAVVGFAPAETNPSAISAASNVNVDAIVFSGSSDGVTPPNSNHLPIYNNLNSSCKSYISILNGSHCYFANSNFNCDFGELTTGAGSLSRGAQQDITKDFLSLWLDFELKSSCTSWDMFLDSLSTSSRVSAQQSCSLGYLQPDISITGASAICAGDSTILAANYNQDYNYTWFLNNTVLAGNADTLQVNTSGTYLVSASNSYACIDSSEVFVLTQNPSYYIRDTVQACIGSTYIFPDGFSSTQNINHISNLTSALNCDSIIERYLSFGSSVSANSQINLCPGSSIQINGFNYSNDTVVVDTLIAGSFFGCDSITMYTISVFEPDSSFLDVAICEGDNYQLPSGLFVNEAGSYSSAFTNKFSCDSTYTIRLSLGTPIPPLNVVNGFFSDIIGDTVFVFIDDTLTYDSIIWSSDSSSSFLYESNDTAYFIWNEVAATYTIYLSVYSGACSSTQFIDLALVSINNAAQKASLRIYPNPSSGIIYFEGDETSEVVVYNLLGQEKIRIEKDKISSIDISSLSEGLYYIKTNKSFALFKKIL